jgi:hypothetical protein
MILRAAGLLLAAALGAFAGDLTGVWTGQFAQGRNNAVIVDVAFKFVQTGATLTGKLYGDYMSYPVIEGKVEADRIEFVVITREQRGNEINDTRFKFTGTFKETGDMELTRERQSVSKVGSGEPVTVRNETKPVIKLKRLT